MKEKTHKQLKKDLDAIYSKYIRLGSAYNKEGMVKCYTCDKVKHWKSMQCSHYISRRILSTRFYERNTKAACVACNVFKEGNKPAYAIALIKEYGKGVLEELDSLSHILIKYDKPKLKTMIEFYKKKFKEIE